MPSPVHHARSERARLAALLREVGPDAPTLCAGWLTRDLAAHLVVRDRRPDAAAGIVVPALAGRTARVQALYAARPWDELVRLVEQGPPRWSPASLAPVDRVANTGEMFVHLEDVRRAVDGAPPRDLEPDLEDALWAIVAQRGRLLYRRSPVGVELRRSASQDRATARPGPGVVLTGPPAELVLHAHGRTSVARVDIGGEPDAVRRFAGTPLDV